MEKKTGGKVRNHEREKRGSDVRGAGIEQESKREGWMELVGWATFAWDQQKKKGEKCKWSEQVLCTCYHVSRLEKATC